MFLHYSLASAILQESLSDSHLESEGWLKRWHSVHSIEFPGRYQDPSTLQRGLLLPTSCLEGLPHLQVQKHDAGTANNSVYMGSGL